MDLNKAYSILEVSEDISDSDLKSKYRKLAAKYHPDVNKEEGASEKFKEITAAYELIKDYRENPHKFNQQSSPFGGMGFDSFFDSFFRGARPNGRQVKIPQNPSINITISFKESVLGASKSISFKRNDACESCNGEGMQKKKNGCTHCNGFGRKVNFQGNVLIQETCRECFGRNVTLTHCPDCSGHGAKEKQENVQINIPAGITNDSKLKLRGVGHFVPEVRGYTDVDLHVQVTPHETLKLNGADVICDVNISLLEALEGKEIEVDTIHGKEKISIPPKSRHNEVIELNGFGVKNSNGSQKCFIHVSYPEDISELISTLRK